jgi:hypothetical protein
MVWCIPGRLLEWLLQTGSFTLILQTYGADGSLGKQRVALGTRHRWATTHELFRAGAQQSLLNHQES